MSLILVDANPFDPKSWKKTRSIVYIGNDDKNQTLSFLDSFLIDTIKNYDKVVGIGFYPKTEEERALGRWIPLNCIGWNKNLLYGLEAKENNLVIIEHSNILSNMLFDDQDIDPKPNTTFLHLNRCPFMYPKEILSKIDNIILPRLSHKNRNETPFELYQQFFPNTTKEEFYGISRLIEKFKPWVFHKTPYEKILFSSPFYYGIDRNIISNTIKQTPKRARSIREVKSMSLQKRSSPPIKLRLK